jgi:hypothetical protein
MMVTNKELQGHERMDSYFFSESEEESEAHNPTITYLIDTSAAEASETGLEGTVEIGTFTQLSDEVKFLVKRRSDKSIIIKEFDKKR